MLSKLSITRITPTIPKKASFHFRSFHSLSLKTSSKLSKTEPKWTKETVYVNRLIGNVKISQNNRGSLCVVVFRRSYSTDDQKKTTIAEETTTLPSDVNAKAKNLFLLLFLMLLVGGVAAFLQRKKRKDTIALIEKQQSELRSYQEALSKAKRAAAIDLYSEHLHEADLRIYKGELAEALGDLEIVEEVRECFDIFVNDVDPQLLKAKILEKLNRYDEAVAILEKVLETNPYNTKAVTTLMRVFCKQGQQKAAQDKFHEYCDNHPLGAETDIREEVLLTRIAFVSGLKTEATAYLMTLLDLAPRREKPEFILEVAKFLWNQQEREQSVQILRSVTDHPREVGKDFDLLFHIALTSALSEMGEMEESAKCLLQFYGLAKVFARYEEWGDMLVCLASEKIVEMHTKQSELIPEETYQEAVKQLEKLRGISQRLPLWNAIQTDSYYSFLDASLPATEMQVD